MCLDIVITTDNKKLPEKRIVYKGLKKIELYSGTAIPRDQLKAGQIVWIGYECEKPTKAKIVMKKGKLIDSTYGTGTFLVRILDGDGHNGHGAFGSYNYWFVDKVYKSKPKSEMKYVTGFKDTPIDYIMIDNNKEMIDGKYPSGYHGCRTIKGARNWGNVIGKFEMRRIVAYGKQNGEEVYVGRRLRFLGIVEDNS